METLLLGYYHSFTLRVTDVSLSLSKGFSWIYIVKNHGFVCGIVIIACFTVPLLLEIRLFSTEFM